MCKLSSLPALRLPLLSVYLTLINPIDTLNVCCTIQIIQSVPHKLKVERMSYNFVLINKRARGFNFLHSLCHIKQ